jgi:carbon monoxide dehydrogenase subunit G
MEITSEFFVPVPVDEAWKVLTDLPAIAPALPGAKLTGVEGEEYKGQVRIKVGPITANYKGTAKFLSKDEEAKEAVLKAEGREQRGQGNATATVKATLAEEGTGTRVKVVTNLTLTGRVAQFGRGVLAEVSEKMMAQFAENLAEQLGRAGTGESLSGTGVETGEKEAAEKEANVEEASEKAGAGEARAGDVTGSVTTAAGSHAAGNAEAVLAGENRSNQGSELNLARVAAVPILKRIAPVALAVVVLAVMVRRLWNRS